MNFCHSQAKYSILVQFRPQNIENLFILIFIKKIKLQVEIIILDKIGLKSSGWILLIKRVLSYRHPLRNQSYEIEH